MMAARAQNVPHIVYDKNTAEGPVSLRAFDKKLEKQAEEFLKVHPQGADRLAQSDGSYPIDAKEYNIFGRRGVILLAAIVKNANELPLKRVYMRVDGMDTGLIPLARVRRQVPSGPIREAYGEFREDSLYLLPASVMARSDVLLLCDFAVNREGFIFSNSAYLVPDFIANDPDKSIGPAPSEDALKTYVDREYPGFFEGAF